MSLVSCKIRVMFYNDDKTETELFIFDPILRNYGVPIFVRQCHTLEVLENDSVIFEIKGDFYTPLGKEDLLKQFNE